jgi:hypothetical protein
MASFPVESADQWDHPLGDFCIRHAQTQPVHFAGNILGSKELLEELPADRRALERFAAVRGINWGE